MENREIAAFLEMEEKRQIEYVEAYLKILKKNKMIFFNLYLDYVKQHKHYKEDFKTISLFSFKQYLLTLI